MVCDGGEGRKTDVEHKWQEKSPTYLVKHHSRASGPIPYLDVEADSVIIIICDEFFPSVCVPRKWGKRVFSSTYSTAWKT